tara:strand:+ start:773 stop:1222 length:450 start_codon:yes stop_codon:yes gene_type:complete
MGKQHNSFKKDMDLLGEAYGAMLGGAHSIQGTGIAAQQAAGHLAAEDGEDHDKTGHLSDPELLAQVKDEGTAGKGLLDAARARVDRGDSLTDDERDALARDAYEGEESTTPIGDDPGEDTDEADQAHFKQYQGQIDPKAKAAGWNPKAN